MCISVKKVLKQSKNLQIKLKGGYSYLIDDVVIKDLNAELTRTGRTWVAPSQN